MTVYYYQPNYAVIIPIIVVIIVIKVCLIAWAIHRCNKRERRTTTTVYYQQHWPAQNGQRAQDPFLPRGPTEHYAPPSLPLNGSANKLGAETHHRYA